MVVLNTRLKCANKFQGLSEVQDSVSEPINVVHSLKMGQNELFEGFMTGVRMMGVECFVGMAVTMI